MIPNQRIHNAFSATRELGIPDEEVKPVLKHLLKVFDRNWELIEAENYRALIDGVFELKFDQKDNKEERDRKRGLVGRDEVDNASKRLHSGEQEDEVSSTQDNNSIHKTKQEIGEMPHTTSRQGTAESSRSCLRDRTEFRSPTHARNCDKGKDPIASYVATGDSNSRSEKAASAAYFKQSKGEESKDEPHSANIQKVHSSSSFPEKELVLNTDPSINTSRHSPEPISIVYPDIDDRDDGSACANSRSWKTNVDIASSTLGDVKLSLKCNSSLEQSNSQKPKLDAVLKLVEHKYLRTYKIVLPQFSVRKLLKDICESYLKVGTESTGRTDIVESSPRIPVTSRNALHSIELKKGESSSCKSESNSSRKNLTSHNEEIVHQRPVIPKRPLPNCRDISKGSENVRVSLVCEVGDKRLPDFTYIPQNIVYQNAFLNISLARISDHDCCSSCSGDCLSSSIPCECARETGGEYAYTTQGLLKEEFVSSCMSLKLNPQKHNFFFCPTVCPIEKTKNDYFPEQCKGHLVRRFIKECWWKCGCDMKCGNRVVQRGITCKLEVFMTPEGKGWGLRTLQDMPKGTFVCEYVGEILTNMELYERNLQSSGNERHTYPVTLDADWGSEGVLKDEEALCLDATIYGNVARFINHRCYDGNLLDIPVEVENPDRHFYHVAFFTTRDVKAFEELTWDYGIDFNDLEHPIKAFECCCQSTYCRGKEQKGTGQMGAIR